MKYLSAAALLLTAAMQSACINDEGELASTDIDSNYVEVTMTINTGNERTVRATYGEDPGTDMENYIDPASLHIYFYTGNGTNYNLGTFIDEFKPESVVSVGNHVYRINGRLNATEQKKMLGQDFRVAVTANWDNWNVTPITTNLGYVDFWDTSYYNYNYGTSDAESLYYEPTATKPIPMYGIATVSGTDFNPIAGLRFDLGQITLVRAMAKIIVMTADAEYEGLSDVKLTHCNNQGVCTTSATYENTVTPTAETLNLPGDGSAGFSVPGDIPNIPFKEVEAGKKFQIYVPEYRLVATTAARKYTPAVHSGVANNPQTPTQISIKLGGQSYTLDFRDYGNPLAAFGDTYFDILRNNIYIYKVTSRGGYSYVVVDWNDETAGDITFD